MLNETGSMMAEPKVHIVHASGLRQMVNLMFCKPGKRMANVDVNI